MSDNASRCGHAPCQCAIMPGGDRYCSDHCRQAAASGQSQSAPCGCGHAACKVDPTHSPRKGAQ